MPPVGVIIKNALIVDPLQAQEVQLGSYLRSEYLNPSSSSFINGILTDVVDDRQLYVRADNGGGVSRAEQLQISSNLL